MARRIGGLDGDQRNAARAELLLDAGLELFARDGYAETTIEELCRVAHVSTKSFYKAFDSREDLYLALMARTTERIQAGVVARIAELDGLDDESFAEVLITTLAHQFADDSRRAVVLFGRGMATSVRTDRLRRENRRWSSALVADIWAGFWPDRDVPDGLATALIGGLFDLVADALVDLAVDERLDADTLQRRMWTFYRAVRRGMFA